jgi:hypothetical protein
MSNPTPDDRIRERFQRLRSETEAGGAPDFQAMLDRARNPAREPARELEEVPVPSLPTHRRRMLWAGGVSGAAIAAALAAVLITRGNRSDADVEFELLVASFAHDEGAWRAPTDVLLNVPGSDLTRSVPSIGSGLPGVAFQREGL